MKNFYQWLGGTYSQTFRTLGYWSLINSIVILTLGWDGWIGNTIRSWFPHITLLMFFLIVVGIALVISIIDLLIVYPAYVAFTNKQAVKNENPVYEKLINIEKEIIKLRKDLKIDEKGSDA